MSIFRNPEYRGWAIMVLIILVLGLAMAVTSGKFTEWTGIRLFAGPSAFGKIVFVSEASGRPEICLMDPDGGNRSRVTSGAAVRSTPAISPLADRIVYVGAFGRSEDVFSVGVKGGKPERLTSATGPKKQPGYSPDGRKLTFISSGRVYIADLNGDNPDPVLPTEYELRGTMSDRTRESEIPAYFAYAWGADSSAMAGACGDAGDGNLTYLPEVHDEPEMPVLPPFREIVAGLLRSDPKAKRRIAGDDRIEMTGVSWASGASTFAASAASRGDGFLVLFTIDEGTVKLAAFRLFTGHRVGAPALAPDGASVVVAIGSTGEKPSGSLVRLDLSSGQSQVLAAGSFSSPSFSPEGDRVLATRYDEAKQTEDIVVIDLATGKVTQLTHDGCSHDAIWTPEPKE